MSIFICAVCLCGCQTPSGAPPTNAGSAARTGVSTLAMRAMPANQPPVPAPLAQMLAASAGASEVTIVLTQQFTLPVGWDSYLTPASALAVQGADRLCGPWTNEALYAPPSLTNRFTASYTNRLHFLRLAIIP